MNNYKAFFMGLVWVLLVLFFIYEFQRLYGSYVACKDEIRVHGEYLASSVCSDHSLRVKFEKASLVMCDQSEKIITKETVFGCALRDWFFGGALGNLFYVLPGDLYSRFTSGIVLFIIFPSCIMIIATIKLKEEGTTRRAKMALEHERHRNRDIIDCLSSTASLGSNRRFRKYNTRYLGNGNWTTAKTPGRITWIAPNNINHNTIDDGNYELDNDGSINEDEGVVETFDRVEEVNKQQHENHYQHQQQQQ
jgi:hypothetical protein